MYAEREGFRPLAGKLFLKPCSCEPGFYAALEHDLRGKLNQYSAFAFFVLMPPQKPHKINIGSNLTNRINPGHSHIIQLSLIECTLVHIGNLFF